MKVLQEGLAGYSGSQDAWINKRKKVKNFGSKKVLKYKLHRFNLLVEFPIFRSEGGPVPDGSDIQSATLSLYKKSLPGHTLSARRLLAAWDEESVNWNQRADGAPWSSPGAKGVGQDVAAQADGGSTVGAGPQWLDIDVSETVRQMSLGNVENHGWLIGSAGRNNEKVAKFYSREAGPGKARFRPKLTISYVPPSPEKLNDTGLTACVDTQGLEQDCPVPGLLGQDAELGRDVTHNDDSDGHAGFSFTKLDENGDALPADAEEWWCVRDNVTGLIWEVKTEAEGLRNAHNTYTWYSSRISDLRLDEAELLEQYGKDGGECVGSRCDTEGYVEEVNRVGLCGRNDWRLPSNAELVNLFDFSTFSVGEGGVHADTSYFPSHETAYWTRDFYGDVYASAVRPGGGWSGVDVPLPVRLVSGADAGLVQESPLTMNGDEVIDRRTGLIWRRCPLGYEWVEGSESCEGGDGLGNNWSDFMSRVEALRQQSGKNWRLPNVKELMSLPFYIVPEYVQNQSGSFIPHGIRENPLLYNPCCFQLLATNMRTSYDWFIFDNYYNGTFGFFASSDESFFEADAALVVRDAP